MREREREREKAQRETETERVFHCFTTVIMHQQKVNSLYTINGEKLPVRVRSLHSTH